MKVLVLALKRVLVSVVLLIISLAVPFRTYGANGRFDISSILFGIRYDQSVGSLFIEFTPDSSYLLPSLLLCTPCYFWLCLERDLRFPMLLGSVGVVVLSLTQILVLFLPPWAVLPWLHGGFFAAYVPEFIDLIPFAGLAFTAMVLLPLLYRVLMYPITADINLGKKVAAAVSSLSVLLLPMTIELYNWEGTDFNRSFFEGYSFNSVTWSLSNRVDGNLWGHGVWFNFSMSSIYSCLAMLLQIVPGIIFLWFVCRGSIQREGTKAVLAAGLTHFLVLSLICIRLNSTASYPGNWIVLPFPALLIIGAMVYSIGYGYRWARSRQSMKRRMVSEKESLSQQIFDFIRSQDPCKALS